jgi:hypothetical protein
MRLPGAAAALAQEHQREIAACRHGERTDSNIVKRVRQPVRRDRFGRESNKCHAALSREKGCNKRPHARRNRAGRVYG